MIKRAIWGTVFAAVFVLSMIMLPAFAGGHVFLEKSEMIKYQQKGVTKIDLAIEVTAKIPKNEQSAFGYGLLGWNSVLVLVTHVPAFDDSAFDNRGGAFHTHVLNLTDDTPCSTGLAVDLPAGVTDPGYINKVGSDNIKIKKVPLADLNGKIAEAPIEVVAFLLSFDGTNLCVDVKSTSVPVITVK